MYIVLGPFGSPQDLVSAMIDNTGVDIYTDGFYITMDQERKDILGGDLSDKSRDFLKELEEQASDYNSICTVLQKRRIEPLNSHVHTYISVDCSSPKAQKWVVDRALNILPGFDVSELTVRNESIVHNYHADYVVTLEDIVEGRLVDKLKEFIDTPLDEKLYEAWLTLIHYDYPWN